MGTTLAKPSESLLSPPSTHPQTSSSIPSSPQLKPEDLGTASASHTNPSEKLWQSAWQLLEENNADFVKKYRSFVDSVANDSVKEGRDQWSPKYQEEVLQKLREKREEGKWRIPLGSKDFLEVKDLSERIIRSIQGADRLITSAVSPQPYAALAWAGISILLPVSFDILARVSSFG